VLDSVEGRATRVVQGDDLAIEHHLPRGANLPSAWVRERYVFVASRPVRERSRTRPSWTSVIVRTPSTFGSNSQSGWLNGASTKVGSIGATASGAGAARAPASSSSWTAADGWLGASGVVTSCRQTSTTVADAIMLATPTASQPPESRAYLARRTSGSRSPALSRSTRSFGDTRLAKGKNRRIKSFQSSRRSRVSIDFTPMSTTAIPLRSRSGAR
jgi:hypothetical protein